MRPRLATAAPSRFLRRMPGISPDTPRCARWCGTRSTANPALPAHGLLRADLFSGQREYYWATRSVRDGGPEKWLISPQVPLRENALAIDRPSGKFRRSSFLLPAIGNHEIPP